MAPTARGTSTGILRSRHRLASVPPSAARTGPRHLDAQTTAALLAQPALPLRSRKLSWHRRSALGLIFGLHQVTFQGLARWKNQQRSVENPTSWLRWVWDSAPQ